MIRIPYRSKNVMTVTAIRLFIRKTTETYVHQNTADFKNVRCCMGCQKEIF